MAAITRLGLYGGPRGLYGSFADVTAPVLSSPTGTAASSTTATGTVSTDEGNGTLYYYTSTNASETAATIKASGSSQAVSASGTQNVSVSGLTASTTYYLHYVQDDTSSNESNVVSSASFTTSTTDQAPGIRTLIVKPRKNIVVIPSDHRKVVL